MTVVTTVGKITCTSLVPVYSELKSRLGTVNPNTYIVILNIYKNVFKVAYKLFNRYT